MTYDDHEDCDRQLNEAEEQILNLKAELKKKDDLLFAYESVKAPVNPLLAENKRLKEKLRIYRYTNEDIENAYNNGYSNAEVRHGIDTG